MRRQPGALWTTAILLAITLLFVVAPTSTALAETEASATGPGGARVSASASAQVKLENETEVALGPVPYNILDEADEDLYLALLAWSSKYRFGLGVQDGDWVRYESLGDGPVETLEIRASKTDAGETWIVETRTPAGSKKSTEFHALFAPGKPKLLKAFRVDENGTREDIAPLDDVRAGELFLEARQTAMDALGGNPTEFRVNDCGDVQELVGPYGKLLCMCLEVQVAEEVDPISFEPRRRWLSEGTLVWLNKDVPRLIPMSAVLLPSLLSPDDMMMVPGGMVRSPYHMLLDYKDQD